MLPGPDHLWLTDQAGANRYTCELRFTMYRPAAGTRQSREAP
jgi:hypothetical protein